MFEFEPDSALGAVVPAEGLDPVVAPPAALGAPRLSIAEGLPIFCST